MNVKIEISAELSELLKICGKTYDDAVLEASALIDFFKERNLDPRYASVIALLFVGAVEHFPQEQKYFDA